MDRLNRGQEQRSVCWVRKRSLKRIVAKDPIQSIVKEYAGSLNIRFGLYEGEAFIGGNDEFCEKKWCYDLQLNTYMTISVRINQERPSFVSFLEYLISSELEKKDLVHEVLSKYKELNIFYGLSEKMAMALDVEELVNVAIKEARKDMQGDFAGLWFQFDPPSAFEKVYVWSADHYIIKKEAVDEFIQELILKGESDILHEKDWMIKNHKEMGLRALMVSPILIQDKLRGLFVMGSEQHLEYTSKDLKLFNAISFLMGVIIENKNLYKQLEETFLQTVKALAETVEKRDEYTGGHIQRVMEYALICGEMLGCTKEELTQLKLAALLHDIGKIGIRDEILEKKYGLSESEYQQMKLHTIYGAEILDNIGGLKDLVPAIRGHHERVDGKGYPDGLQGSEIPLFARIIAVADTFDAMITDRPYRRGLSKKEAIEELKKFSGKQFDQKVVDAFLEGIIRNTKRSEDGDA